MNIASFKVDIFIDTATWPPKAHPSQNPKFPAFGTSDSVRREGGGGRLSRSNHDIDREFNLGKQNPKSTLQNEIPILHLGTPKKYFPLLINAKNALFAYQFLARCHAEIKEIGLFLLAALSANARSC